MELLGAWWEGLAGACLPFFGDAGEVHLAQDKEKRWSTAWGGGRRGWDRMLPVSP